MTFLLAVLHGRGIDSARSQADLPPETGRKPHGDDQRHGLVELVCVPDVRLGAPAACTPLCRGRSTARPECRSMPYGQLGPPRPRAAGGLTSDTPRA